MSHIPVAWNASRDRACSLVSDVLDSTWKPFLQPQPRRLLLWNNSVLQQRRGSFSEGAIWKLVFIFSSSMSLAHQFLWKGLRQKWHDLHSTSPVMAAPWSSRGNSGKGSLDSDSSVLSLQCAMEGNCTPTMWERGHFYITPFSVDWVLRSCL